MTMLDVTIGAPPSASGVARRAAWAQAIYLAGLTGLSLGLGGLMLRAGPSPQLLAWLVYLAGAAAILWRPQLGVFLILGLSLLGDGSLTAWYPFNKNFSSRETLLFLSDAAIVSPLETYIGLTALSWLGRAAAVRRLRFVGGPLLWPAALMAAFIAFGLAYGIVRGGSLNIALWEARAIFYLPAMIVLVSNLLRTPRALSALAWTAAIALAAESLFAIWHVVVDLELEVSSVERIAEHSLSIHLAALFAFAGAAWVLPGSWPKRLTLPLLCLLAALPFLANQRRAGFVVLAVAAVVLLGVLLRERPRVFALVFPLIALLAVGYLAAFWNAGGVLGQPARAVRTALFPDSGNVRDQASNVYRVLENLNIAFTIHAAPLTGVGFGNKFFIVVPLADISFFVWWEYITHNSLLWVWMKAGLGGFASVIFLVLSSLTVGMRAIWRVRDGDLRAVALFATLYILMHFIYAYVDMSWDIQSMVFVGAAMGLLNVAERADAGAGGGR